jgi:RNA polymerase sigma factor (sigma-70 family)
LGDDVYRDHGAPVWRYARARLPSDADAEDVTSDVFVRALRSWDQFDSARGSLRAWLIGIARHAVADFWRRRREEPMAEPPEQADPTAAADPERFVMQDERSHDLQCLLSRLTPREQEAIALRFGAELSSREVGEVLGISPTAARMLVHRGVTRLREVVADG